MFNISFPYRSCKHVRPRRGGVKELVEGSRPSKRVAMRKKSRREGERQSLPSIISNQPPPPHHCSSSPPSSVFALEAINDDWRKKKKLRPFATFLSARRSRPASKLRGEESGWTFSRTFLLPDSLSLSLSYFARVTRSLGSNGHFYCF